MTFDSPGPGLRLASPGPGLSRDPPAGPALSIAYRLMPISNSLGYP